MFRDQTSTCFFRRTRRGHVLRIVEEQYLRTDLGLGSWQGRTLSKGDFVAIARKAVAGGGGWGAGARRLGTVKDTEN